jgi:hypothetical protein
MGRHSRMRPVAARAAGGPPRGTCWHAGPAPPPHRPAPGRHLRPALGRHRLTTPARNLRAGAPARHLLAVTAPRGAGGWAARNPSTVRPTPAPDPLSLSLLAAAGRSPRPTAVSRQPCRSHPCSAPVQQAHPSARHLAASASPRWIRSSVPPHRSRPPPQQTPTAASQRPATQRRSNRSGARHRLRRNPAAGGRWVSRARSSVRARLTHRTPPAPPPDPRCPGPRRRPDSPPARALRPPAAVASRRAANPPAARTPDDTSRPASSPGARILDTHPAIAGYTPSGRPQYSPDRFFTISLR